MKPFSERNPLRIGAIGVGVIFALMMLSMNYDKLPFFPKGTTYSFSPAIIPAEMGYGHVPAVRAFDDGALAIATSLHSSISLRARTRLRT